ncbi:hypothetical protein KQX54_007017 [Cotesia glomerata]|uniref:Uncharacterized protein n=1 Tax=Cotesia glomerata TaxID=32391 RepID=A0AAV7J399_COTGL|nr:hypothetical protein KQX54_007017 [Cotesia glomerata]
MWNEVRVAKNGEHRVREWCRSKGEGCRHSGYGETDVSFPIVSRQIAPRAPIPADRRAETARWMLISAPYPVTVLPHCRFRSRPGRFSVRTAHRAWSLTEGYFVIKDVINKELQMTRSKH